MVMGIYKFIARAVAVGSRILLDKPFAIGTGLVGFAGVTATVVAWNSIHPLAYVCFAVLVSFIALGLGSRKMHQDEHAAVERLTAELAASQSRPPAGFNSLNSSMSGSTIDAWGNVFQGNQVWGNGGDGIRIENPRPRQD